jgi:Ribbon-helix-helix protein, copG family.
MSENRKVLVTLSEDVIKKVDRMAKHFGMNRSEFVDFVFKKAFSDYPDLERSINEIFKAWFKGKKVVVTEQE